MGRVVREFGAEHIREVIVRPYRVIYVVRDEVCYIAAVVHSGPGLSIREQDLERGTEGNDHP